MTRDDRLTGAKSTPPPPADFGVQAVGHETRPIVWTIVSAVAALGVVGAFLTWFYG